ncbi:MAG: hypothetical protein RSB59_06765, partial [Clostridia bacterium]
MFWDNEKLMRTRNIKHQNGNQNKLLNRVTKVALLAMLFVMSFSVMISGMIDGTFLSASDIFSKIDSAVTGNPQDDNSSNIAEAASSTSSTLIDLSGIVNSFSQPGGGTNPTGINPDVTKKGCAWTTDYDHINRKGYWSSDSWNIGDDSTSHDGADYFMAWFDFDLGNNWDKLNDCIIISLSGKLNIPWNTDCGIVALGTTETLQGNLVGKDDYESKIKNNKSLTTTGEVGFKQTRDVNFSHSVNGRYARIYFAIYDNGGAPEKNSFNNISVKISHRAPEFSGGNGRQGNPYILVNRASFDFLANQVNNNVVSHGYENT